MCPLSGDFVDMLDITSRYINGLQKQLKLEDVKLIEVVKFHFIFVGSKIYNSTDYDIRRRLAIGELGKDMGGYGCNNSKEATTRERLDFQSSDVSYNQGEGKETNRQLLDLLLEDDVMISMEGQDNKHACP